MISRDKNAGVNVKTNIWHCLTEMATEFGIKIAPNQRNVEHAQCDIYNSERMTERESEKKKDQIDKKYAQ